MAVTSFIPQLWAAMLADKLRKQYVYAQLGVINRNYQGMIENQGDTVKINMINDVTVSSYSRGDNLGTPEDLVTSSTDLVVDQANKIHFKIEDLDAVQAAGDLMGGGVESAANGFADTIDQYIAGLMAAGAATANLVGTTASPKTDLGTTGQAYAHLLALGTKLDEANVPTAGRFVILPPWYHEQLLKDSTYIVGVGTDQSEQRLRNGVVGDLAGFRLLKSNNVPNTSATKYKIIAGVSSATTFAEQIVQTEAFRSQDFFADVVRGLHVYGAKVVFPSRIAVLTANRP